ncbi:MAG TPA: thrombospondin type 3 repeat-containing protein, partial [Gemmatimonadales bacterium]|nr:thrombospondin type 3 repeat-containing protein [Gemmatimonadales bacterium]
VAVVNNDLFDQYTDVTATLRACAVPFVSGSCSTPSTVLAVLDSPKNIGRLPVGQPEAVSFSIQVGATPQAQGMRVYLRLDLSQTGTAKDLGRLSFEFVHAMGADRQSLHYSTDYPNGSGGAIARDLNRSSIIEPNDRPHLTLGALDETVNFSSLFAPVSGAVGEPGRINNVQCTGPGAPHAGCAAADEAYPALGILTAGTGDGLLDRHVLVDANPAGADMIPWSFDANQGGWYTARDAASILGTSPATRPVWHWVNNGTCGFQTQSKTNCVLANGTPGNDPDGPGGAPCAALTAGPFVGGVWHTGSGVAGTCAVGGAACYLSSDCAGGANGPCNGGADNPQCGNFGIAFNPGTSSAAEFLHDYLVSPILEKVNQGNDANGFPFVVEFQRLAFNNTTQIDLEGDTLYINVDNNVDSNTSNSIIKPGVFRGDGLAYYFTAVTGPIDPYYTQINYNQTTFGPLSDPDGSLAGGTPALTGDESGFTGFDNSSVNPYAVKPIIPQAPVGLRPFPGANDVHVGGDDVAGPARSFDLDLVDTEDAIQLSGYTGPIKFFTPGDAGKRFQIGLSFLDVESVFGANHGDFGISIDDVVFEWDEVHPVTETTPACDRVGIGGPNEIAAGCRCATLSVDRANLYDCNETVAVVVNDPRYAAGATCSPTGNAGAPDVIQINAWSNSEPFPGEVINLTETGNATGIFRGNVPVSGIFNSAGVVFTVPGLETNLFFAYEDNLCDSNENHQAGQSDFDNLDGDGIQAASGRDGVCGTDDDIPALFGPDGLCGFNPATLSIDDTGDNCALVYNVGQADADSDKVGGNDTFAGIYFGCDNCPLVPNPDQTDSDQDGVGNACDWDDVDGDGVINKVDNCPDWSNPGQTVSNTAAPRGEDCDGDGAGFEPPDDGDGIPTVSDNCTRTANTGQADTDGPAGGYVQPLGDACDGDCQGTCVGGSNPGGRCVFNPECPGGTCGLRVCSSVDDDADIDFVPDSVDDCPVTNDPALQSGSNPAAQADDDFNGIGNACDPAGSFDANLDGLPDDVANGPFFAMAASCKAVPLANLVVLSTLVRDRAELKTCVGGPTVAACVGGVNVGRACASGADCPGSSCGAAAASSCGDGDAFADPGERVRIALFLQNTSGFNLTGINLALTTADPDIECILDTSIAIPALANGAAVDTRSLSPGDDPIQPADGRFFEAVISPSAQTTNPQQAARGSFILALNANEAGGIAAPTSLSILLDLDVPAGASQT